MSSSLDYSGSGSKIETRIVRLEVEISDIEKRLEKLENTVEEVRQKVVLLRGEVDNLIRLVHDIRDDVRFMKKQVISNGRKYTLYVMIVALSFISAILGLHWVPPH